MIELPVPRNSLQRRSFLRAEVDDGAAGQLCHSFGHEHFAGLCASADAGRDMHSQSAKVLAANRAFSRMQAGAYLDAERTYAGHDGQSALNCSAGPSKLATKPSPVVLISMPW